MRGALDSRIEEGLADPISDEEYEIVAELQEISSRPRRRWSFRTAFHAG